MHLKSLVGAVLLSSVAACAAVADTTIRILTVENDPLLDTYWEGLMADYEAQNPGIDVVREYISNMDMMAVSIWSGGTSCSPAGIMNTE